MERADTVTGRKKTLAHPLQTWSQRPAVTAAIARGETDKDKTMTTIDFWKQRALNQLCT